MHVHRTALVFLVLLLLTLATPVAAGSVTDCYVGNDPQKRASICLLQSLWGATEMAPTGMPLIDFMTRSLPWIQEVAVGFTILWIVIGGIMIMVSGNNTELRGRGKKHATWAIMGLLMLFTLGFILELLNSLFFVQ
jgi:hypothetical protein